MKKCSGNLNVYRNLYEFLEGCVLPNRGNSRQLEVIMDYIEEIDKRKNLTVVDIEVIMDAANFRN